MALKKECIAFRDAAKLVKETTWLESKLAEMGAEGAGIWEKFNYLRSKLPQKMEKELIEIATIRNEAVHGNPNIPNLDDVLIRAQALKNILHNRVKLDLLLKETDGYQKQFQSANIKQKEFHDATKKWLNALNEEDRHCQGCLADGIDILISKKAKHFNYINSFIQDKALVVSLYKELQKEWAVFHESKKEFSVLNEHFFMQQEKLEKESKICSVCVSDEFKIFVKDVKKAITHLKRKLFFYKMKKFFLHPLWISFYILSIVFIALVLYKEIL
ncbi:hypothetical protein MNB_SM-6-1463 [hydrothermal vent metagenome]|uniref:Uncharacterized protein n=1 Tax=hydrothermal vent metagenome TaxID=652676 RepID=A0A1W1CNC8_9ZZZZ